MEDVNLTNVRSSFFAHQILHLIYSPCDAGIINSFKAQYRKLLVRNRIEAYEISQELNKEPTTINIHDSIDFSVNAWESIKHYMMKWRLQDLINELPFDNLMDADEFLHIDDCLKSNEGLTDDEIVSMIKSNNNNESEMDPDESLQ
ncbi:unnamed protein product [Rhizophagus irregularis]|nr:unnamed protein product [Rhizophagus irregularis]